MESPRRPGSFSKASRQGFGVTGKDGVAMALELLYDHSREVKAVSEPRRLMKKPLEVRFVVTGGPEVEPQTPELQGSGDGAGDERIETDDLDTGNIFRAFSHALPIPKGLLAEAPDPPGHGRADGAPHQKMPHHLPRLLPGKPSGHESLKLILRRVALSSNEIAVSFNVEHGERLGQGTRNPYPPLETYRNFAPIIGD